MMPDSVLNNNELNEMLQDDGEPTVEKKDKKQKKDKKNKKEKKKSKDGSGSENSGDGEH